MTPPRGQNTLCSWTGKQRCSRSSPLGNTRVQGGDLEWRKTVTTIPSREVTRAPRCGLMHVGPGSPVLSGEGNTDWSEPTASCPSYGHLLPLCLTTHIIQCCFGGFFLLQGTPKTSSLPRPLFFSRKHQFWAEPLSYCPLKGFASMWVRARLFRACGGRST